MGGKSLTNALNAFMYSHALPSTSGVGNFIRIISLDGHSSFNSGFTTAANTSNGRAWIATTHDTPTTLQKSSRSRYASNAPDGTPRTTVFASTRTSSNSSLSFAVSSSNPTHHHAPSHTPSPSSRSGRI